MELHASFNHQLLNKKEINKTTQKQLKKTNSSKKREKKRNEQKKYDKKGSKGMERKETR